MHQILLSKCFFFCWSDNLNIGLVTIQLLTRVNNSNESYSRISQCYMLQTIPYTAESYWNSLHFTSGSECIYVYTTNGD